MLLKDKGVHGIYGQLKYVLRMSKSAAVKASGFDADACEADQLAWGEAHKHARLTPETVSVGSDQYGLWHDGGAECGVGGEGPRGPAREEAG